jgi:ATP-dependent DNA ligase
MNPRAAPYGGRDEARLWSRNGKDLTGRAKAAALAKQTPALYVAFDLFACSGVDLRTLAVRSPPVIRRTFAGPRR